MRRRLFLAFCSMFVVSALAAPALACGGLIGPNGAVNLTRTTTLAAHHAGVEHYITSFEYAGGGGKFGSIVPLPALPTKVEKGGDWTLQRLQREKGDARVVTGSVAAASSGEQKAVVVYEKRIDALDITVLKGGGRSVGEWASQNGFRLPPDAPEVLDFYADRSQYFMAAVFDSDAAKQRGQEIGDGTPIHITMPLRSPWVPLRILGLGKQASETVEADVFLLTDRVPALLPSPERGGYRLVRQVDASEDLLADLRSDRGMGWLPKSGMTLTYLEIATKAPELRYDLAINSYGAAPSRTRAGLPPLPTPKPTPVPTPDPTIAPTPTEEPVRAIAAPTSDRGSFYPVVLVTFLASIAGLLAWTLRRRQPFP
jgi:hypothetical protein